MARQRGNAPRYAQIAATIRARIIAGEYGAAGARVPSEPEITDVYQVSKTTASEALRLLEQQGLIVRRSGIGSFIAEVPALDEVAAAPGARISARQAGPGEPGDDGWVLVLAEPGRPARAYPAGRTVIVAPG